MQKTLNYNLNKPEPNDPLRVADFNENADKIDAALGALNTAVAAGLKIETGSYNGTGVCGSASPNKLTFPFPPKVVGIVVDGTEMKPAGTILIAGQTASSGMGSPNYSNSALSLTVSWSENSVSWYASGNSVTVERQFNIQNRTYFYFAIG